jgi:hypothetical protein
MFERLMLTEIALLLILGVLVAICIYAGRMLRELRWVNHHLHALRNKEDWLGRRVERELLALNLDRHREPIAQNGPRGSGS